MPFLNRLVQKKPSIYQLYSMNRVKITLPNSFRFCIALPIRITDLNYGNHVANDVILSMLHEARVQYLASFHQSELNFFGIGLIMSDVQIEYKHQLYYGDNLFVEVQISDVDKLGFDIYYHLFKLVKNELEETKITCAKAKTGMICYDYQAQRKVPTPEAVYNLIS